MKLLELNDDCLEAIFRRLPLQTGVRTRAVCRKFKAIIEERICQGQHSLMLFNSFNNILRYCDFLADFNAPLEDKESEYRYDESKDLVIRGDINEKKVQFLLGLFPNVKNLVLFYTKFHTTTDLINLVSGWNAQLQSFVFVHPHKSLNLTFAFHSINLLPLPALKSLTVTGERRYLLKTTIKMPKIIGRLEELTVGLYACDIEPVLKQVGLNLRKLRFHTVKFPLEVLKRFVAQKPYIKTRLTHFSIDADTIKLGEDEFSMGCPFEFPHKGVSEATFKFIGSNFKALTYLDITPNSEVILPFYHSLSVTNYTFFLSDHSSICTTSFHFCQN